MEASQDRVAHAANAIATRHGEIAILPNDKPIAAALQRYGEWAQIEIEFIEQFLAGCNVILDVGSHVGTHALAFASAAPSATIHAFEPQPTLYELLNRNASGKHIVTHSCAIGATAGKAFMRAIPTSRDVNAGSGMLLAEQSAGDVAVDVRTIDSMDLRDVGFIKLDVEGGEGPALSGATALIARYQPVIYCEVNTIKSGLSILDAIRPQDYQAYLVGTPAFNPTNYNKSAENIFGNANESALLLIPKGRRAPRPLRAQVLQPINSVDSFVAAFLTVPRYGDTIGGERDADEIARILLAAAVRAEAASERASALSSRLSAEQTKAANLHDELRARTDATNVLINENKELRHLLGAARSELVRAQDRLAGAQMTGAAALAALGAADSNAASLAERLNEVEVDAASARGRVTELEADLAKAVIALSEASVKLDSADRRFEAQRISLSDLRSQVAKLRADLAAEQHAHDRALGETDAEKARRRIVLDLLDPGAVPAARRDLIGKVARRYMSGRLANALRDIETSTMFDADWYAKTYPDAAQKLPPSLHYLLIGGYEGCNPSPKFDSNGYFVANTDVRSSGMNPLLHYLHWGARELRRLTPQKAAPGPVPPQAALWARPTAPSMAFFRELSSRTNTLGRSPAVDVIVPVYRSYDDTLACIASVLTSPNQTPFELVVIDDCSPEPEVSAALDELAQMKLITLFRNSANLGFVGTVNKGMALHADRDVLLLNSDTLVFNNWLDRIRHHALKQGKVATITPFTNNGTICSYPKFCRDNRETFDRSFEEIDRLASTVNEGQSVEVPTGVGFCMYITRLALDEIGLFDQETFGKGYGEENDFCMRASKAGWRNFHALDVFVFHSGETSFAESAPESKRRGLALLQEKHPEYDGIVGRFIERDPARSARIALDIVRLLGRVPKRATLCISHTSGGGIERFLNDLAARNAADDRATLLLLPSIPGTCIGRLTVVGVRETPVNLERIDLLQELETLRDALALLRVDQLEVHSTVGWSVRIVATIERLARSCSVSYSMVLHDYVPVCPQINLINENGRYCGEEGPAQCSRCVALMKDQPRAIHPDISDSTGLNVLAWRNMYRTLLSRASRLSAPSNDTANRFRRYFSNLTIEMVPHVEDLSHVPALAVPQIPGQRLRVGIIGAIGPHKGSRVLLECARDAVRRALPLEFVVVGYADVTRELEHAQVTLTGPYRDPEIGAVLERQQLHAVFNASVCPETFSYTLSIAMRAGFPVCAFDLGAQAERLSKYGKSLLLKIDHVGDPSHINDQLLHWCRTFECDNQ